MTEEQVKAELNGYINPVLREKSYLLPEDFLYLTRVMELEDIKKMICQAVIELNLTIQEAMRRLINLPKEKNPFKYFTMQIIKEVYETYFSQKEEEVSVS